MLSCIYEGKVFTTKQEGYTTEDKYTLGRNRLLFCPCCHTSVFYCDDGKRIAHFAHHKLTENCTESKLRSYDHTNINIHDSLIEKFVAWVKSQFPEAKVYPDYLISKELKTDVYFEMSGFKTAIEIQFKKLSNPLFLKRKELYRAAGINDIWFFVVEGKYSIGSPYHRTYYKTNRNKREIYFYQIDIDLCKIIKGLAKEKWDEVGANTLRNSVSVEIPLKHIKIKEDGTLFIPELRDRYLAKANDIRRKNRLRREAQRFDRVQQKQGRGRRAYAPIVGDYKVVFEKKPEAAAPEVSLLEKALRYKKIAEDKDYQDYREKHFEIIDGKELLHITIAYRNEIYNIKYYVLEKQETDAGLHLTCRKEAEPDNIRYSIETSSYLDSLKKIRIQKYNIG